MESSLSQPIASYLGDVHIKDLKNMRILNHWCDHFHQKNEPFIVMRDGNILRLFKQFIDTEK